MKIFRVVVFGDREWKDAWPIRRELEKLCEEGEVELLIHGACRGADTIAGVVGAALGIPVKPVPAEWKKFGNGAGPIRNQKIIDKHQPNIGLGFHKNLAKSKGTKDMKVRLEKAGIEVRMFKI